MAKRTLKLVGTKIQWTWTPRDDGTMAPGYSFNIVWGCERVSPACKFCYAEVFAKRVGLKVWGPTDTTERRVLSDAYWREPLKWQREAAAMGEIRKVFCSSMADVFEDHPTVNAQRARLWALIEATPNLTWMLLTKRPENIAAMVPSSWMSDGFPLNVWVGITAENQEWYERRIPHLARIPAVVRFLSVEPQLGPIDLGLAGTCPSDWNRGYAPLYSVIHLVICGGESGHGARPFNLGWMRQLRDECERWGVDFFGKQLGACPVLPDGTRLTLRDGHGGDMTEWAEDLRIRKMPRAMLAWRNP